MELVRDLLPSYLGSSSDLIIVKSVDDGTLVYVNRSLLYAPCDDPRVDRLLTRLVDPRARKEDEGEAVDSSAPRSPANPALVRHMAVARLKLLEAGARPSGKCLDDGEGE